MEKFDFSKTEAYLNEVISAEQLKDELARRCMTMGDFINEENCTAVGELLATCRDCYELLSTIQDKTE